MRAALEWFLQQAEGKVSLHTEEESGLRMAAALWLFWDTYGYVSEGRRWLDRALAVGGAPTNACVDALNGAAYLAMRQADVDTSFQRYEESLTLARQLGYQRGIAVALSGLGYLHETLGDNNELMESLFAESLDLWRVLGDKHGIARALGPLAHRAASRYDFNQSKRLFQESLALFKEVGDQREIAGALWNLGDLALRVGDCIEAEYLFTESLVNYRELKDIHGIATQLRSLGEVARCQGNPEQALDYLQEALSSLRKLEDRACTSHTLLWMARVALDQGKLNQANSIAQEALEILRLMPQSAARPVAKTIRSAMSNAEENFGLSKDDLVIAEIVANSGPVRPWRRFGARGRFKPIRKRTSHIRVVLEEVEEEEE